MSRIPLFDFIYYSEVTAVPAIILSTDGGNQLIVDYKSETISGTFNYILLSGADVTTATFLQAGGDLVLTSGTGTINIPGGSQNIGDPIILVVQSQVTGTIIGAYEAQISEVN